MFGVHFEDLHRGGWDPEARLARPGRATASRGEILYPTVGMVLCNHPRPRLQAGVHGRLQPAGSPSTAPRIPTASSASGRPPCAPPDDGIARSAEDPGARPPRRDDAGDPGGGGLRLPGLRRLLRGGHRPRAAALVPHPHRASRIRSGCAARRSTASSSIIRGCQDCMGTFVFGGVFERHPRLRSSASRPTPAGCRTSSTAWTTPTTGTATGCPTGALTKMPSEYFRENIYVTFQDDWVAFQVTRPMNVDRLMWANDFPHSDSTWPWSQEHARRAHRPSDRGTSSA